MKSYLSLISISARVRRRQNRLTILCIVTAVFLVTAIFSVADMMLRTQTGRAAGKSGSWHLEVTGITPEQAAQLVGQPDVVRVGAGAVFNENGESAYRLNGKRVVLYGADADYVSLNRAAAFAGTYPQAENEVLLGKTAARVLHVGSGDTVTLTLPDGTEKAPHGHRRRRHRRGFLRRAVQHRGCLPAAGSLCGPADCKQRGTAPDTL